MRKTFDICQLMSECRHLAGHFPVDLLPSKEKKMRNTIITILAAAVLLLAISRCQLTEAARTEANYEQYCGACHQVPDPRSLSKSLWTKQVLPEMGARLGIKVGDYNPVWGLDMEETFLIEQTGTYPKEPLITQKKWEAIYNYVVSQAPDSLDIDTTRRARSLPLEQFTVHEIAIDKMAGAQVSALYRAPLDSAWWIGTRSGEWYQWSLEDSSRLVHLFSSAVSGFDQDDNEALITEMGFMNPVDIPRGKLWRFIDGKRTVLAEMLHRPVYVERIEANGDSQMEYLVCEFGNRTGTLSLLEWDGTRYRKKSLISKPGMIRIQVADVNGDGRDDIVALAGQGDEGIYILYNQGDGRFSLQHPISLSPVYGSSWFELFDYDGDGDLDVALVNGDNADFTYTLKPYHGFRLFLNGGDNEFSEAFFFPIYGATRLIARDFDADGDVDFAIAALFPDFDHNPRESFLYLENQDPEQFTFQSYTTPATMAGHWLVMETADIDHDNDLDILLGSYVGSPAPVPDSLTRKWIRQNVDLLWLENQMGGAAQ